MKKTKGKGGFVATSELIFIITILVIGLIAGWVTLRNASTTELEDLAESLGDMNQSFAFNGVLNDNASASTSGSQFVDAPDVNAADSDDGNIDGDTGTEFTLSPPAP